MKRGLDMERLKNVYKVFADLGDGESGEILVFSHSHDNAAKKAKVYFSRSKKKDIQKVEKIELIHKDVIY